MLSRVGERIYWSARYLERVENTARLVGVYAHLLFDLPSGVNISWYNLVELNGSTEAFDQRYLKRDERNVVKFILSDDTNPSSLLSSLRMVRENLRTTRDVVPNECWELINELSIYANKEIQQGINRRQRYTFLEEIIRGCQQMNGRLAGTMSHDAAWALLRIGRDLERADMTTRILDAGCAALQQQVTGMADTIGQVVWGNVLRSLSAYLPYRRGMRVAVSGPEVVSFLIGDSHFPRTVAYNLAQLRDAAAQLPNNGAVISELTQMETRALARLAPQDLGEPFRAYINELQLAIAGLHHRIAGCWFTSD